MSSAVAAGQEVGSEDKLRILAVQSGLLGADSCERRGFQRGRGAVPDQPCHRCLPRNALADLCAGCMCCVQASGHFLANELMVPMPARSGVRSDPDSIACLVGHWWSYCKVCDEYFACSPGLSGGSEGASRQVSPAECRKQVCSMTHLTLDQCMVPGHWPQHLGPALHVLLQL